jgi:hypothetical protein
MAPDGPPADGELGSLSPSAADGVVAAPVPDPKRSRLRVVVAGGVTLAVVALGIGGALALRGDRPDGVGDAATVTGVDLPAIVPGDQSSNGAPASDQRVAEARTRLAEAVEDGEAVHAQAAARGATSSAVLRRLRGALDAGAAALEVRPPDAESPESRTTGYLETLDARRSAILDATAGITDARQALPGSATPRSNPANGSDGTAETDTSPDEGGRNGGDAGAGDPDGGETAAGGSEGGGSGSTGGGTTPPPASASPSAEPTASAEPTPEPSPDPTPSPTPSPTVSPTATSGPTGAPPPA